MSEGYFKRLLVGDGHVSILLDVDRVALLVIRGLELSQEPGELGLDVLQGLLFVYPLRQLPLVVLGIQIPPLVDFLVLFLRSQNLGPSLVDLHEIFLLLVHHLIELVLLAFPQSIPLLYFLISPNPRVKVVEVFLLVQSFVLVFIERLSHTLLTSMTS